jgi:hypothetical protein
MQWRWRRSLRMNSLVINMGCTLSWEGLGEQFKGSNFLFLFVRMDKFSSNDPKLYEKYKNKIN